MNDTVKSLDELLTPEERQIRAVIWQRIAGLVQLRDFDPLGPAIDSVAEALEALTRKILGRAEVTVTVNDASVTQPEQLTIRDHFAIAVLQGTTANSDISQHMAKEGMLVEGRRDAYVRGAYEVADLMIEARKEA